MRPEDYLVQLSDTLCALKIKPFDAPFNIMGMPAFMGYYVTHGWGSDYFSSFSESILSFAPLIDSTKPPIEHEEMVPAAELRLVYAYEFPLKAYLTSAATYLLVLSALGFWVYYDVE